MNLGAKLRRYFDLSWVPARWRGWRYERQMIANAVRLRKRMIKEAADAESERHPWSMEDVDPESVRRLGERTPEEP